MGGNAALTGDPDRAPVRCTLPTAYYAAGPDAAAGIAMALYARERSGRGQLVDVSMQECQLATLVTAPGSVLAESAAARPHGGAARRHARDLAREGRRRDASACAAARRASRAWSPPSPGWRKRAWRPSGCASSTGQTYNHNLLSAGGDRAARGRLQRLLRHQDAPRALRAGAGAAHHARPLQRRARDPRAAAAALARALHDARVPGARRAGSSTRISSRRRAAGGSASGAARRGSASTTPRCTASSGSTRRALRELARQGVI